MALTVKAVANSDDVFLIWCSDEPLDGCLGFAIYRKRNGGDPELLKNRVGFEN
jgi:hypothetical protein